MNCKVCKRKIVLKPSAEERAKKFGKTASYYINLFQICTGCKMRAWYG